MGLDNPLHIVFLLLIVLLIFGAKRLPEMGRSLGSGLREFKQSISADGVSEHPALPVRIEDESMGSLEPSRRPTQVA